jgi:hypothetical protein
MEIEDLKVGSLLTSILICMMGFMLRDAMMLKLSLRYDLEMNYSRRKRIRISPESKTTLSNRYV